MTLLTMGRHGCLSNTVGNGGQLDNAAKTWVQEQLGARSAEGRRLRRRVLRGTVLVCIVAGYHGKRFIYERAKELGVRYCCSSLANLVRPGNKRRCVWRL